MYIYKHGVLGIKVLYTAIYGANVRFWPTVYINSVVHIRRQSEMAPLITVLK